MPTFPPRCLFVLVASLLIGGCSSTGDRVSMGASSAAGPDGAPSPPMALPPPPPLSPRPGPVALEPEGTVDPTAEEIARLEAQIKLVPVSAEAKPPANANVAPGHEFSQVRVFFATDRKATGPGEFGGERNPTLTYGNLIVSIPREHEIGGIEKPSLWRLEFSEDPRKHMVIMRRVIADRDGFMADLRASLARGGSESSFLFVHGYNVSFDDAARRTAQITYDLDYRGAPVFYSWPSQASLKGYTEDENNVQWSEANLKSFLLDYARHSGAQHITLIAHSMGNRALTGGLRALFTENPDLKGRFKEIILTAPDIDAEIFKRDLAPALAAGCDKITLYVSDGDKALLISKTVHGYRRAGDSSEGVMVAPGIETVDASGVDTSFLEHSYFASTGTVLADIRKLVLQQLRAAQRGLSRLSVEGRSYWKINTANPAGTVDRP